MVPLSLALIFAPDAAELRQFDFWVGDWECAGKMLQGPEKWQETKARNTIRKILGGKVIEENFRMVGLNGRSVSVYNPSQKRWFQTWVDDGGGYIPLSGAMDGKKMILNTRPAPGNPSAYSRMVFSDITRNGFLWRWEGTKDDGRNWTLNWELHYTRVKPMAEKELSELIPELSHFGLPLV